MQRVGAKVGVVSRVAAVNKSVSKLKDLGPLETTGTWVLNCHEQRNLFNKKSCYATPWLDDFKAKLVYISGSKSHICFGWFSARILRVFHNPLPTTWISSTLPSTYWGYLCDVVGIMKQPTPPTTGHAVAHGLAIAVGQRMPAPRTWDVLGLLTPPSEGELPCALHYVALDRLLERKEPQ